MRAALNNWSFVWNDLDNTESDIATDDPNDVIVPGNITATKHQFIRQFRARAWSTANLTKELAGSDPSMEIGNKSGDYWGRQMDRIAIATINGIIADNVANDSGDMVHNITAATGTVVSGGKTVNAYSIHDAAVLDAKQTMGDNADGLAIIVMHSVLYTNLQKQNLIAFIPNSQGVINIPTYMGYEVLVSDQCPAVVDGSDLHYTTYLAGRGVLGWADSPPDEPVAIQKEALQGNGAGVETLVTRKQFGLHPMGFTYLDGSTAGQFPTNAELALAANWNRVYPERKQIPLAVLKTKNG